jgi:hypothetical protein
MNASSPPSQPGRAPARLLASGGDEHGPAVAEQAFDLDLVPVPGVGQDYVGLLVDARAAHAR